jgi:hypothetical protein
MCRIWVKSVSALSRVKASTKMHTNLHLDPRWKQILRKAWSIRFIILAGILTGLEVILPMFSVYFPVGTFALLSFGCVVAAFVARIMVQKDLM